MNNRFLLGAVCLVSLAVGACGGAQGGAPRSGLSSDERRDRREDARPEALVGWTKLGERWVTGAVDHDTIAVGAAEGTYSRILLRVEHSALEMFDVVVTFGDGSSFSPPTRHVFNPGTNSHTIDLPGNRRVIRRVDFRYGNLPGGGRAQLELWAR